MEKVEERSLDYVTRRAKKQRQGKNRVTPLLSTLLRASGVTVFDRAEEVCVAGNLKKQPQWLKPVGMRGVTAQLKPICSRGFTPGLKAPAS